SPPPSSPQPLSDSARAVPAAAVSRRGIRVVRRFGVMVSLLRREAITNVVSAQRVCHGRLPAFAVLCAGPATDVAIWAHVRVRDRAMHQEGVGVPGRDGSATAGAATAGALWRWRGAVTQTGV